MIEPVTVSAIGGTICKYLLNLNGAFDKGCDALTY